MTTHAPRVVGAFPGGKRESAVKVGTGDFDGEQAMPLPEETDEQRAEREGANAFWDDVPSNQRPSAYQRGKLREAWLRGWWKAKGEVEQQNKTKD